MQLLRKTGEKISKAGLLSKIFSLVFVAAAILVSFAFLVNAQDESAEYRYLLASAAPTDAKTKSDETVDVAKYDVADVYAIEISGTASYYGAKFHNRRTANGERFDMNGYSAAHKSLPFGTILRAVNRANGKSTLVRINDRGPFVGGRFLDLSKQAAREIEGLGLPKVEVKGFSPDLEISEADVNNPYYYGYSLDENPICVPASIVEPIDSTDNFDSAVGKLKIERENAKKNEKLYLMIRTDLVPKREGDIDKVYVIAKLRKEKKSIFDRAVQNLEMTYLVN